MVVLRDFLQSSLISSNLEPNVTIQHPSLESFQRMLYTERVRPNLTPT